MQWREFFDIPDAMGALGGQQIQMPESNPLAEPLLDANDAARLLRVPRSTLYELVRSRGLPHVRIGRRGLRFTRAGLARWIGENSFGR
jgi:excisionase family DNA binding protein